MIDGYVHPDFSKVAGIFHHQIERNSGGAAVAVYHRGELVVDLWGGTRNGHDAPVATYWPEFAQNGKEGITVRHVLSHSAGLHRFATIVDRSSRSLDWQYMADALAR